MNRPAYQTVLFDLDGTILNTIDDLAGAGNWVCRQNGWPEFSTSSFMAMVGHGIPNLVTRFSPPECQDPERLQKTLEQFTAYYGAHNMDKTAPYPGIPALLEHLNIPTQFAALGASNAFHFQGALPEDREALAAALDSILETAREEELRDYRVHLPHL